MIVVMKEGAAENDIDYVVCRAGSLGLKTHVTQSAGQTLIGLQDNLQALNSASKPMAANPKPLRPRSATLFATVSVCACK